MGGIVCSTLVCYFVRYWPLHLRAKNHECSENFAVSLKVMEWKALYGVRTIKDGWAWCTRHAMPLIITRNFFLSVLVPLEVWNQAGGRVEKLNCRDFQAPGSNLACAPFLFCFLFFQLQACLKACGDAMQHIVMRNALCKETRPTPNGSIGELFKRRI